MRATTASKDRGNAATPLSEMEHPVLEVLEGIRVQRMSLVQSLRQFVFVHRGQSFSLFTLDSTDADK
jgi:protein tyrosine phosphatase